MNTKEMQEAIGTTPDGIPGPKTYAALRAAGFEVMIDPGHTRDHAREHPQAWPRGYWQREPGLSVAEALGISEATEDSVEHALNLRLATLLAARLEQAGIKVLLYDEPALGNNEEINRVCRYCREARPRVFLSLHANASLGIESSASNTACGTIAYYAPGNGCGETLARRLSSALVEYRRRTGGPHNRADLAQPGRYSVLTHCPEGTAGALVEVGFYDHDEDLRYMATHGPGMADALAEALLTHLNG